MTAPDITVVLTAHSETLVAGPTVRSAEMAIRAAEAAGCEVERLIALDAASDECSAFFAQPAFAGWRKVALEVRDLGRVRNELARVSHGRWIAWLDADDLFSENWLAAASRLLFCAEKQQERVIVHPELNWVFDGGASVFVNPTQGGPLFAPLYFYASNYYDSLCIAPRVAITEVPYTHYDFATGFAFEDWPWNIETMAAGWRHVVAPDTIIFKRRRDMSLVVESSQRRTMIWPVEPMAIDQVYRIGRT